MEITLNEHTVDEETELFQSGFLHVWREGRGGKFANRCCFGVYLNLHKYE